MNNREWWEYSIEELLEQGNDIYCAACPTLITKGNAYNVIGDTMYCKECSDSTIKLLLPIDRSPKTWWKVR